MANLKTEVDKLDIDKLKPAPTDLSRLSNTVKNDVKKTDYDKLVVKVNNIDTSDFVLKTNYQTVKTELENKIPDTTSLIKKTDHDAKITEIEGKNPDVSSLATKSALTVENKIPSVSNLVNKTDYNTKLAEIENKIKDHNHDKYITTPEFNIWAAIVFNARLLQKNLMTKTIFDNAVSSLDTYVEANQSLGALLQRTFKKLRSPDLGYFKGKNCFEEDGTQSCLVF